MDQDDDLEELLYEIESYPISSTYSTLVVDFFNQLNDSFDISETSWEYYVSRLAGVAPEKLNRMEELLEEDSYLSESEENRFTFFFALMKIHLHREDTQNLERLVDNFGENFEDEPLYLHIHSQKNLKHGTQKHLDDAIRQQVQVVDEYGSHAGVQHQFALLLVEYVDCGYGSPDSNRIPSNEDELLGFAEGCIDTAIDLEQNHGQFHVTKGRILSFQGKYDSARNEIEKGISLENTEIYDYPVRISQYRHELMQVDIREQQELYDETLDQIDETGGRIDDLKEESNNLIRDFYGKTLQFLGFFAAIITVAVTSVTIATQFQFPEAGRLVLVLIGGLLCAFSGFSYIIPAELTEEDNKWSSLIVFVAGIIIIAIGYAPILIELLVS